MSKYFFNHAKDAEAINEWFKKFDFKEITLAMSGNLISGEQSISLSSGNIVFIHATDIGWWINKAKSNPNVDFVFISRDAAGISKDDTWPNNIYICKYPADRLNEFDRAKIFFKEIVIENGNRLWELLLPDSRSHLIALSILCQGYLAAHGEIDLPDNLGKLKEIVKSKVVITEDVNWWLPVISGNTKSARDELGVRKNKKAVEDLLDAIDGKDGKALSGGEGIKIVESAYKVLPEILQGTS